MSTRSHRSTRVRDAALGLVLLAVIALGLIVWTAVRPAPDGGPPGTARSVTDPPTATSPGPTPAAGTSSDPAPPPTSTGPLPSAPASSAGTPEAVVPSLAAPREVVLVVRTDGPTDIVHGVIGATQTQVRVIDDWRLALTLPDADTTVRVWATGAGATEVACEILVDGVSVVRRSGYGVPPEAICAANVRLSG